MEKLYYKTLHDRIEADKFGEKVLIFGLPIAFILFVVIYFVALK